MQSLKKFYFGKQKVKVPNTFIGGIGGAINTPALLATKLGISKNRIKLFKVTGVDVECAVIGGSYNIPIQCWTNNLQITYYRDEAGLVSVVGQQAFGNIGTQFKSFYFPKATKIEQTIGNWSFQSTTNLIKNTWKFMYVPLVTQWGNTQQADINGQSQGTQVFRINFDFNGIIYAHPSLQTSNAGGLEGDLAYLLSLNTGATIRYVTNFTPPNPVTNLSTGTIYNTAVQLNFTPPTSVNGVDFYEAYINGERFNSKEIKNSGEFITGLTPSTNYNIRIVAVDMFYNKSELSNTVNVSTTNRVATDVDAISYINASSNTIFQDIIDDMFIGFKTQGLYAKTPAFYPFLGTTQAQHKWNAKNPLDTNAAFRLQFFGGGTHSNLGYQCNGTNAYANTFLIPSAVQNLNSNGLTVVVGTNNTKALFSVEIGAENSNTQASSIYTRLQDSNTSVGCDLNTQSTRINISNYNNSKGIFTGTKTVSNVHKLIRNGNVLGTGAGGGSLPTIPFWIGKYNSSIGPTQGFSNQRIQFTAIHEGLTDAEVVALHTIIDNFESAIGRKTW